MRSKESELRERILKDVERLLEKFKDEEINFSVTRGLTESEDDEGFIKVGYNNTLTMKIEINGGAEDIYE